MTGSLVARLRSLFSDTDGDPAFFLRHVQGLIHVGANRAQERDTYAALGLNVLWIEALPDVFADLERHIAGFPRQRALRALVTDTDGGTHTFHVSSNQGLSSSLYEFGEHQKLWSDIQMVSSVILTGIRLDTLLHREKIVAGAYRALLLDTQGSELLVLRGAGDLLDGFDFIQAEAADFNAYAGACQLRDLDEFLGRRGFKRVLKVPMAGRAGIGSYYDAVYVRRRHATYWRLRLLAAKLRRGLQTRAARMPIVERLREMRSFARDVLTALARRLRHGGAPGLWQRWSVGPFQLHRPRLWLRLRRKPPALLGAELQIAPFDYDHVTVYREIFEENAYDFSLLPFVPDRVIDCGAHIGSFSALAAVRFTAARLIAFEPDSQNNRFLRRNLARFAPRVRVSSAAVATKNGTARFREGGHWAHLVADDDSDRQTVAVPLRSLPDVLREEPSTHLLLKLDIEGAEVALIPAILPHLPACTAIFFESHGGTDAWTTCRDALARAGFKVQMLRTREYQGVPDAFVDAFAWRQD